MMETKSKNPFKEMDEAAKNFMDYLDTVLANDNEVSINSIDELINRKP